MESYKAACLSTAHLTPADHRRLDRLQSNMVICRDTGWFVKLYEEPENNFYPFMSREFNDILVKLCHSGYRMVEFDCDGPISEYFPNFDGE